MSQQIKEIGKYNLNNFRSEVVNMKAIKVFAPGDVRMIETAKPIVGPKDILARVVYSGICGTDLSIISGDMSLVRDGSIKYPVRIGHEWSGIVENVGIEVKGFKPGDHVVSDTAVTCGVCENCLRGEYNSCSNIRSLGTINSWDGSFAEYMIMPHRHMHKLPENVNLDEAALIEPATIAYAGVCHACISPDSSVLVVGTGAIGLSAVTLAKNLGAGKVVVSGRKRSKLLVGKAMGADAAIETTSKDLEEAVLEATGGKGVNTVIETSGNIITINQCINVLQKKGTLMLIGFYEAMLDSFNIDRFVTNQLVVKGIMGEFGLTQKIIDIMAEDRLNLKPLITHRYKFDEAVNVMKNASELNANKIKILVEMN
jgi:Threonine dehydrogenase and related Zn-dependent dehydrogenases